MSQIRLKNLSSKILILLSFIFFFETKAICVEAVDIWSKNKKNIEENKDEKINNEKPKIDYLKEKNNLDLIEISETKQEAETQKELLGLFDPEKNDLNLNMWSNTEGSLIRDTFKRIEKMELSDFSENIFIDTIFTYSYPPKGNFTEEEFLNLKINWLIKNNKIELIEKFLNMNFDFSGKSKLIQYLVDHYIASGDISSSCEKVTHINKEIKNKYLDKFRIYCLILNKKYEQAQLNFDLLREEGRSEKFFNQKILFLLGLDEKSDNKISDKNLLYFYLSSVTIENFKYQPTEKTDKNIWKYLTASNLISTDKLEDPEIIQRYEVAANQGTFDKNKIFEIYLSVPFNINQLINAQTAHLSLSGYEARALIYQKTLLADDVENKLKLLFLLKDLFDKDKLNNVYNNYLSNTLKLIEPSDIPENLIKIVERNIILEKNKELGKIKYDDKVLHRSKVIKIFTEENPDKEKANKDFLNIYKKISKNKKYFFSIKDVIVVETLSSEGFDMPKQLDNRLLSNNFTVPANLNALIDKEEIGMLMLKLTEIIGSDDVESLDPETLYFIVNLLNRAKIKKIRNKILNLTLPLRV